MNIAIVGTDYAGLVTRTYFAEMGAYVTSVDVDAQKIKKLKDGIMSINEHWPEEHGFVYTRIWSSLHMKG